MWMMGYNEPHEDHININMNMNMNMNMVESYTNTASRKLRPLVPRPPPPTCAATSSSYNRFHSTHHDHLLPLNHHLVASHEPNKREFNAQQMVVVSSRWNPTPEQLQTLEELYRRGTRTPSADEIQHITAQLRRYGKIEGKNVFYWFQNHKARERQKRRRQLDNPTKDLHQPSFFTTDINTPNLDQSIQRKDSEIEETRNWAIPTFTDQRSVLRERPRNVQGVVEEEEENLGQDEQALLLHRRRKSFPARWNNMMQSLSPLPTNHITTLTTTFATKTSSPVVVSSHDHDEVESYETLELFPVNREQPEKCFHVQTADVNLSPRQFIEFLPVKK